LIRALGTLTSAAQPRVCVGFSGGLDSTVLLDLLAEVRETRPIALSAAHVHHGLSPNAEAWSRHCRAVCRQYRLPFILKRVSVVRAPRTSLEEQARDARYAALSAVRADVIALAHHADDQAETILLQLMRGAGAKGLAGMASVRQMRGSGRVGLIAWRPLLDCTRAELATYAQARRLEWIDDESNLDVRFKRNFVRAEVMPLLARGFPAPVETLSRAARHLAESAELADALADIDLAHAQQPGGLDVGSLRSLADSRLKNALRRWFARLGMRQPSEARLLALVRALRQSRDDSRLTWEHEGRAVRRQKGILTCH
jgi:tRNA(Ile)-lysidine synthase